MSPSPYTDNAAFKTFAQGSPVQRYHSPVRMAPSKVRDCVCSTDPETTDCSQIPVVSRPSAQVCPCSKPSTALESKSLDTFSLAICSCPTTCRQHSFDKRSPTSAGSSAPARPSSCASFRPQHGNAGAALGASLGRQETASLRLRLQLRCKADLWWVGL